MGKPVPLTDLPPDLLANDSRGSNFQDMRYAVERQYNLPAGTLSAVQINSSGDPLPVLLAAAEDQAKQRSMSVGSGGAGLATAVRPRGAVPPADLPEALRAPAVPAKPAVEKAPDPSEGGSTLQFGPWDTGLPINQGITRALAGAGKSFVDTSTGIKQFLGMGPGQEAIDERARHDAPLMDTGAGTLGYVGGTLAQTALPGAGYAKGAGALGMLAPTAGRILANPYTQAAVLGGGYSALQPVLSGESRTANAAVGAGLGALGTGTVDAAKRLVRPAYAATSARVADLAKLAKDKYGIDLTAAQISDSPLLKTVASAFNALPFSGASKKAAEQESQWARQVSKTMGEDNSDLAAALPAARDRIGKVYDNLAANNTAKIDTPHLISLTKTIDDFEPYDMTQGGSATKGLQQVATKILDATDQNNEMTGEAYKALRSKIGKMRMSTTDSNLQDALKSFQTTLDDAMRSNLANPADLAAWHAADKQWANMRTLEKLAPKDSSGQIDMKKLASVLSSTQRSNAANRNAFVYGSGDQTLPDLARIGTTFLDKGSPHGGDPLAALSGVKRAALGASELGATGLGMYALLHDDEDSPWVTALGSLGAAAAGGAGGARALNSRAFAAGSPALTSALTALERAGVARSAPLGYGQAAQGRVEPLPRDKADKFKKMSHAELYNLREGNQDDKALQGALAPLEHQAFAREATAENPLMALPISLATPLYAGAKSVGLMNDANTTPPSVGQVKAGLQGVLQGLGDAYGPK